MSNYSSQSRIGRSLQNLPPIEEGDDGEEEESGDYNHSGDDDQHRSLDRPYCAKFNKSIAKNAAERLVEYNATVDLLEDPNFEIWDRNGSLTSDFLSNFSDADAQLLFDAFYAWRNAPRINHPPGEGKNIWPWWAEKYPQHTGVAWNIYWDYHVRRKIPSDPNLEALGLLPAFKPPALMDRLSRVFGYVIAKAKASAPSSPSTASNTLDEIVGPERRNAFAQGVGTAEQNFPDRPIEQGKRKTSEESLRPGKRTDAHVLGEPSANVPKPLTTRALKYGESLDWVFQTMYKSQLSPRKSGVSPIHRPLGAVPLTPRSNHLKIEIENYQKGIMEQAILQDLHELEVLEYPHALPNNLCNPVLPILARFHWKTGTAKRSNGQAYDVMDEDLWEALLPSLRLLTLLLSNCHITDWWDDLDYFTKNRTTRIPIPGILGNDGRPYKGAYSIPQRSPEQRTHDRIDWNSFVTQITWEVKDFSEPIAGAIEGMDSDAYTECNVEVMKVSKTITRSNSAHINISALHIAPLLETGIRALTESEKLVQQFFVAETLFHEMAHAYFHLSAEPGTTPDEPFYHDDTFSELGWSMENNVFGGFGHSIFQNPRESYLLPYEKQKGVVQPIAALYMDEIPNFDHIRILEKNPMLPAAQKLLDRKFPSSYRIRPVPIYYIEALQQQEFWDSHIKKGGGDLLKVDRWIVEWLQKTKARGPEGVMYNDTQKSRGRLYKERLAEALGNLRPEYPEFQNLPNPTPEESMTLDFVHFMHQINQRMRAVAMRRHMREKDEAIHKQIYDRNLTVRKRSQLAEYERDLKTKRRQYETEMRRLGVIS